MYNQCGMYGYNPCYTLAETPYARMTGMFTPINENQIPNADSYLQPTFIDMNPYLGNTGIPAYPSFIGGTAMMNSNIPIIQPNEINAWQQQHQNYPQQSYYQQPQQPTYRQPQQAYYQQPQQPVYGQSQQTVFYGQQPQAQMYYSNQQVYYGAPPPQQPPAQDNFFGSFIDTFQQALGNIFG